MEFFVDIAFTYLSNVRKFLESYGSYNNRVDVNVKNRVDSLIMMLVNRNISNLIMLDERKAKDISERILRSREDISVFLVP